MTKLTVKEIWRYPVKSMRGEMLSKVRLERGGIPGDRIWVVRGKDGATIPDRKNALARLLDCSARYDASGAVEITLPDGDGIQLTDATKDDVATVLGELVGQEVSLWRTVGSGSSENVEADAAVVEAGLRRMCVTGPKDTWFPDVAKYPPGVLRDIRQSMGRYARRNELPELLGFDIFPVNVLTEASLRYLEDTITRLPIDRRRYRPNFLVADDQGVAAPLELGWEGHEVAFGNGEARLFSIIRCPRCVMPSLAQQGAGADLARDAIFNPANTPEMLFVSTYAVVLGEGRVAVGDAVHAPGS